MTKMPNHQYVSDADTQIGVDTDTIKTKHTTKELVGAYAVIYDTDTDGEEIESYYGYFDTIDEARRKFHDAYPKGVRNAWVVQIIDNIGD